MNHIEPLARQERRKRPRLTIPSAAPAERIGETEQLRLHRRRGTGLVFRYGLLPERGFEYVSDTALELTGYTVEEHYADPDLPYRIVAPDDRERLIRILSGQVASEVVRWRHRDGRTLWVELTTDIVSERDGAVLCVEGSGRDVTDRQQAAQAAEATEVRWRTLLGQATDAILVADSKGLIEYVNPAFERITGYAMAEVLGRSPRILKSGLHSERFYDRLSRLLAAGSAWRGEIANRRRDGTTYVSESVISPVTGATGQLVGYIQVSRDLTRVRELSAALDTARRRREDLALAIAGLVAGSTLEATAERVAAAALVLDGAGFGAVIAFENHSRARVLGLATELDLPVRAGDLLPSARAAYLRERAALGPWTDRWRSPHEDSGYGRSVAASGVRAALYVPIEREGEARGLLVIGTALPDGVPVLAAQTPAGLELAAVAQALLLPQLEAHLADQDSRQNVVACISERAFDPVYQPILELRTGQIVGFEALTRFTDGRRPDSVFAEARRVGLGLELEVATLAAAVAEAERLPEGVWLGLNVSPKLILDNGRLAGVLSATARSIVLEVTEHEQIPDYDALRDKIALLGPHVLLAVDDTGAGVANFSHLVELRPHFVKLDMSLVRGVDSDAGRQAIIVGLRHFALASSSILVAEGIETEAERDTLLALGLGHGLGFLLGAPAPAGTWSTTPSGRLV